MRSISKTTTDDAIDKLAMTDRQEWLEAYRAEFRRFACDRQGWEQIDAGAWAQMLSDHALAAYYQHGTSPEEAAQTDVLACEEDCAK